jgi:hypothetical protein
LLCTHPKSRILFRPAMRGVTCTFAIAVSGCGAERAEPPPLELREEYSRQLPDSFQFVGATFSSDGSLVLWSSNRNYLLLVDEGRIQALGAAFLGKPVAAVFSAEGSEIEVVDAVRSTIVVLSRQGMRLRERRFYTSLRVSTATRIRDLWLLGGRGLNGRFALDEAGAYTSSASPGRSGSAFALHDDLPVHLSQAGGEVLLTNVNRPFAVQRFDSLGAPRASLSPKGIDTSRTIRELTSNGRWVSLPALAASDGYLQTLSDLTSDRRILILYDSSGAARRYTVLDIPVGFVASHARRNLLAGARRTHGLELVVSAWAREGDSSSTVRSK